MREDSNKNLEFIGDFEKLYENERDPWSQMGGDSEMAAYYKFSRKHLLTSLKDLAAVSVLEIGCGLGMVTEEIRELPLVERSIGLDISPTAIRKASTQYPGCEFLTGDIKNFSKPVNWQDVDVVVINQALWYIIDNFDQTLNNVHSLLSDGGYFINVQAFFRDGQQRYGKEIINGFGGLIELLSQQGVQGFDFISGQLTHVNNSPFDDGHVLLSKK